MSNMDNRKIAEEDFKALEQNYHKLNFVNGVAIYLQKHI